MGPLTQSQPEARQFSLADLKALAVEAATITAATPAEKATDGEAKNAAELEDASPEVEVSPETNTEVEGKDDGESKATEGRHEEGEQDGGTGADGETPAELSDINRGVETQGGKDVPARQGINPFVAVMFEIADRDGSGELTKEEIVNTIIQYPEIGALLRIDTLGGAADPPHDSGDAGGTILASPEKLSELVGIVFDEMDTVKSSAISIDEFDAFAKQLLDDPGRTLNKGDASFSSQVPTLLFRLADQDSDGTVSRDELKRVFLQQPVLLRTLGFNDAHQAGKAVGESKANCEVNSKESDGGDAGGDVAAAIGGEAKEGDGDECKPDPWGADTRLHAYIEGVLSLMYLDPDQVQWYICRSGARGQHASPL